jgi:glucose-fructose oxidoreductase
MPTRKRASAKPTAGKTAGKSSKRVRYAVVGLGYFSQSAILPAFAHAKNSELVSLVSDDPEKIEKLGRKYKVKSAYRYEQFQDLLDSGDIDAAYIALPNDLHKEYAVRAAMKGIHVLVEKPMALNERDCEEMIRAANEHQVRLMVGYRLHLEAANLKAVETVQSGAIGDPRFFDSAFSMQVGDGNIRVQTQHGGGPVWDLGIYCVNAARYLFRDEPYEAFAISARKGADPRFNQVDEMTTAILRFPEDRQAAFTCSFGAAALGYYTVAGTEGSVCVDQAYDYAFPATLEITVGGKARTKEFEKRDQVAAELIYFSDCVLYDKEPEPSGIEGLADVRIINAILESARTGKPVPIERIVKRTRPSREMEINQPAGGKTGLIHVEAPSRH